MKILASLFAGLVFGLGLIVSGMTDPAKVIGFLDLAGNWNPSLAFVMVGAILVGSIAFWLMRNKTSSLLDEPLRLPTSSHIDKRLIVGALMFGIGWGLAGFCPGPALASLVSGGSKPLVFTLSMIAGMAIFEALGAFARKRKH